MVTTRAERRAIAANERQHERRLKRRKKVSDGPKKRCRTLNRYREASWKMKAESGQWREVGRKKAKSARSPRRLRLILLPARAAKVALR